MIESSGRLRKRNSPFFVYLLLAHVTIGLWSPGTLDPKGTKYPWIAASWQSAVEAVLELGETPLAAFEPDLDERLHFSAGFVLLTDRRVLAANAPSQSAPSAQPTWRSWHADGTSALRAKEHGGVG